MHIVYRVIFSDRIKKSTPPYYYIGSKSNCCFDSGLIYDKNKKLYYGSSCYPGYTSFINDSVKIEVISEFDSYTEALNYEAVIQKSLDVVADVEYFNLSIATTNNFTNPDYASYKHIDDFNRVCVRLPRNHPKVLSGEYVGVSKGVPSTEERKQKQKEYNKKHGNAFKGKHHTEETKSLLREKRKGWNVWDLMTDEQKHAHWLRSSKPKSEEHKRKIGRKGLITLRNKDTDEVIRIKKGDAGNYDKDVWMNPYALSVLKSNLPDVQCPVCKKTATGHSVKFKNRHFENCDPNRVSALWLRRNMTDDRKRIVMLFDVMYNYVIDNLDCSRQMFIQKMIDHFEITRICETYFNRRLVLLFVKQVRKSQFKLNEYLKWRENENC